MNGLVAVCLLLSGGVVEPDKAQNTNHFQRYHRQAKGFNLLVLKGVDAVQSHSLDGGGYFIGVKADPPESPICYDIALGGKSLIDAPRSTSFCSGASYAAFIEATNYYLKANSRQKVTDVQIEALRMQEPDGKRREDGVKAWGWWNADGFGCHFSLVQLMKAGERISPKDAKPGDFMNISWKSGLGHSVVFLGWEANSEGKNGVRFWSSQTSTNGLGDLWSPFEKISEVCIVRCTKPKNIFVFEAIGAVDKKIKGDKLGN